MNFAAQVLGLIALLLVAGVVISLLLAEWLYRVIERALKDEPPKPALNARVKVNENMRAMMVAVRRHQEK